MKFPESTVIHAWRPACWLRVTGEDAAKFLQGQFTNELRGLAAGGAVYGLWLTVKGKVVADSFIVHAGASASGPGFWVGSYFSSSTVIRERLEPYVIADDVLIEDVTADWAGFTLFGDGIDPADGDDGGQSGLMFPGRRGLDASREWLFPVVQRARVHAQLAGLRDVDAEEMGRRRIAAAVPAVPADIGPGDLPSEGGLDDDAISFTKGCYLGQEVMARLKSMGQVRRRLIQVMCAEGMAPTAFPVALFEGERKAGELRSAAGEAAGGWVGLAMVSLMQVQATTMLALAADAKPTVRVVALP